jgi:hypothetical protein
MFSIFIRPFYGLEISIFIAYPAMNCWAIFNRPLRGLLLVVIGAGATATMWPD